MMPVRRLLQLGIVRARLRLHETADVRGITLIGHPSVPLPPLCMKLDEALDQVVSVDPVLHAEVLENIGTIVITERFRRVLARDGVCFLPADAPALQSTRRLGGWAVWASAYIGAVRETGRLRRISAEAADAACVARLEYYRGLDRVQLAGGRRD
jgi:hypothetical protein